MNLAVSGLRVEPADRWMVGVARPRLSWKVVTDIPAWTQASAELEWVSGGSQHVHGVEGRQSSHVDWPFEDTAAHGRGRLRVRVTGSDGTRSDWSDPVELVAGFLDDGEWTAAFLALDAPEAEAQPGQFRAEFDVRPGLRSAMLYATALGAYQVEINGSAVDDQILKPGWTPYRLRLIHESTDVTAALVTGRNAIGATVAGAWYTERYGFFGQARPHYGTQPAFAAQLVLEYEDGTRDAVVTGPSWRASASGPLRSSGIYAGEAFDARRRQVGWSEPGFDDEGWSDPVVVDAGVVPSARTSPAVRAIEELPAQSVLTTPSGKTIVDFGQNIAGQVRIRVTGSAGDTVVLRHAEVLEVGELGTRPLRAALATDSYTLAGGGVEEWQPQFTFHGFRYVEVTGWPGPLDAADITAIVVHSDMERTGWFECSDPLVNRLHDNVVWGMRGNFLYLPTDCPQRDERLGWTGDIQVFAPTASFLYDCRAFLASWLVDLALEQSASGAVPIIVPNVLSWATRPAAGWGDAATVVPSVLCERFGDAGVLAEQYDSMRAWADQIIALAGPRRLWENHFQFGDWLDPDAPADQPGKAKVHHDIVATAYLYRSTLLVAQAARRLGRGADAEQYGRIAEEVRDAWLATYATPDGRMVSDAPTAYALAIMFEIPRDEQVLQRMGDRLAWLVRRSGYHIGTGFIGTPIVLDALVRTGHLDSAGRLVLQTENPSWLYSVTMGATTVWERWDSILEDGSVNPGEMTSFNHYAFGAVADWLHRTVAGLAPADPGYQTLEIAPRPIVGLDWAEASHETPFGRATVRWESSGGTITVTAVVPPNTRARVQLPGADDAFEVGSGVFRWPVADPRPLSTHRRVAGGSSLAEVIDDPEAYRAILGAIASADPERARQFRRHTEWVPEQTLAESLVFTPPSVLAGVDRALAELNDRRGHAAVPAGDGSAGAEDHLPQVVQEGRHVAAGIEEPLKL